MIENIVLCYECDGEIPFKMGENGTPVILVKECPTCGVSYQEHSVVQATEEEEDNWVERMKEESPYGDMSETDRIYDRRVKGGSKDVGY